MDSSHYSLLSKNELVQKLLNEKETNELKSAEISELTLQIATMNEQIAIQNEEIQTKGIFLFLLMFFFSKREKFDQGYNFECF